MSLSSAVEIGRYIATLSNNQNDMKEDIIGDDIEQSLLLSPIDTAQVETTVTIYKKYYSSTAFIVDHPVYGEVDSSTLEIDGGYLQVGGDTFPLSFPINFATTPGPSTVLHDTYTG